MAVSRCCLLGLTICGEAGARFCTFDRRMERDRFALVHECRFRILILGGD